MEKEIELLIIGGGPAGTAAGVYAARKQLNAMLVAEEFGGQSVVSPDIHNWIGTSSISGTDLAKSFKEHLEEYKGTYLDILEKKVSSIQEKENILQVTFEDGMVVLTSSLFLGTGSLRRQLDVPGAAEFEHKGLTYCASCDGPLFAGKDVVVIGGGNAGFETAAQLLAYAKTVTLLHRSDTYKADQITVKKVLAHPNMTAITNAHTTGVTGETFVNGLTYKKDEVEHALDIEGIFVEIGLIPNTQLVGDLVEKDAIGRVKVDPYTHQSSHKKIWAAGDCCDGMFHQNNIAAGDAVKALEHIYLNLRAS